MAVTLILIVSSLTQTQYLQIEPSGKGAHTNDRISLKCFICTDSSDEQNTFNGLCKISICSFIRFLNLQLNEFLQSEIKQKLSSAQKITCITTIADKNIISVV